MEYDALLDNSIDWPGEERPADASEPADASVDADQGQTDAGPPSDPFLEVPARPGVLLLTDVNDRLVLLTSAADMRRMLRSRLQPAPESEEDPSSVRKKPRADLRAIVKQIRWANADSRFETDLRYLEIARQVIPKTYAKNLGFSHCWFVQIADDAEIPVFEISKRLTSDSGHWFGPFTRQADATLFVQSLQDVFDLCRYQHVLLQAPNGQACMYAEMNRCGAPCAGEMAIDAYRLLVRDAIRFAAGDRDSVIGKLEDQMHQAAQRQAFEEAGISKQRIERAKTLGKAVFSLVQPVEKLNYLILQKGRTKRWIQPFFTSQGWIHRAEQFKVSELNEFWAKASDWWNAHQVRNLTSTDADHALRSEHIWLLHAYLARRQSTGLFLHQAQLRDRDAFVDQVNEVFNSQQSSNADDTPQS